MKMPMFGRTGRVWPSSTKLSWSTSGALTGVAGAMMASTDWNRASCAATGYQALNFWALTCQMPGSIAPAISR